MRPDVSDFEVIRVFGVPYPEIICKRVEGSHQRYGLFSECLNCDFRFACATGGLYDIVGKAIESEDDIEVTTLGDSTKRWLRK